MMIAFECDLDTPEGRVVPTRSTGKKFVGKPSSSWDWRDLRDYVVSRIESFSGPFVSDPVKEYGIFNSFVKRWGPLAGPIAQYVFETHDGMWSNRRVVLNSFCKANDPWFGSEIASLISR